MYIYTFVSNTLATQLFVYLFIRLLTARENLVEHCYQTLYADLISTYPIRSIKHGSEKLWLFVKKYINTIKI